MKITIVIPTFNEEQIIKNTLNQTVIFLEANLKNENWNIIIADNGSTDSTLQITKAVMKQNSKINYVHLKEKGRGRALKKAWQSFPADFYLYMDCDLSTDLKYIIELINNLKTNNDLVVGSRLSEQSKTTRGLKREIISRFFNLLLRFFLKITIKDSQCGFKGINQKVLKNIVPLIKDENWFFDTELIFWSLKKNLKIKELPVTWIDSRRKTRVKIIHTIFNYLKNIYRLYKYV